MITYVKSDKSRVSRKDEDDEKNDQMNKAGEDKEMTHEETHAVAD